MNSYRDYTWNVVRGIAFLIGSHFLYWCYDNNFFDEDKN